MRCNPLPWDHIKESNVMIKRSIYKRVVWSRSGSRSWSGSRSRSRSRSGSGSWSK